MAIQKRKSEPSDKKSSKQAPKSPAPQQPEAAQPPVLTKVEEIHLRTWPDGTKFNPRTDLGDLRPLTESIKRHGLIEPVVVAPRAEGGYWLVAGERRLTACKAAEMVEIPANVMPGAADIWTAYAMALTENSEDSRTSPSPMDLANAFKRLKEHGWDAKDIAATTGYHHRTVMRYVSLAENLTTGEQETVRAHGVGLNAAVELGRLNADTKDAVISKVAAGGKASASEIRRAANEHAASKVPPPGEEATAPDSTVPVAAGKEEQPQDRTRALTVWAGKQQQSAALKVHAAYLTEACKTEELGSIQFCHIYGAAWALAWVRGVITDPNPPAIGDGLDKKGRPNLDQAAVVVYSKDGTPVARPSEVARKAAVASAVKNYAAFWMFVATVAK